MTREERLKRDKVNVEPVLFYGGPFSNFSPHEVVLPSPWTGTPTTYQTGEHRFQAMKACDQGWHDYVRSSMTAKEAKLRGRQIALRSGWGSTIGSLAYVVMLEVVLTKARQNHEVFVALAETCDRPIYEDSPTDDIWGWRKGEDYSGKNLLGECWMRARQLLDLSVRTRS